MSEKRKEGDGQQRHTSDDDYKRKGDHTQVREHEIVRKLGEIVDGNG